MVKLRQLRLAKDAMDRDWAEPALDLDAVAAHAGYSRSHFLRAFKEAYGQTPGQYLSLRRTERAGELLRTADLSVTEICGLVGFSSLGTFSARFKERTGLTPSAYRARHLGRGAALIPGCYALLWAGGLRRPPGTEPAPGPSRESGRDRESQDREAQDCESQDHRSRDGRSSDARSPDARSPDARSPDGRSQDSRCLYGDPRKGEPGQDSTSEEARTGDRSLR